MIKVGITYWQWSSTSSISLPSSISQQRSPPHLIFNTFTSRFWTPTLQTVPPQHLSLDTTLSSSLKYTLKRQHRSIQITSCIKQDITITRWQLRQEGISMQGGSLNSLNRHSRNSKLMKAINQLGRTEEPASIRMIHSQSRHINKRKDNTQGWRSSWSLLNFQCCEL